MKKQKNEFYNIYSEFYKVNKFRELKRVVHHGDNRLDHIARVSKLSFYVAKFLRLDYISCTRGAFMHDFFTQRDISRSDNKSSDFYKEHPQKALLNAKKYFSVNKIETDVILKHMYPITKKRPQYKESTVVCLADKIVSGYEYFRFKFKLSVSRSLIITLAFMPI